MSVPPLAVLSCGTIVYFLTMLRANHKIQRSIIRSFGIILAFIFMIIVISPIAIMQKNLYKSREQVLTPLDAWNIDFPTLKGMIKDKVVLTDPDTSYFLTYYTSAYVVAIPPGHGSPYINHEARIAEVSAIFDPNTNPEKRYELLNKYQVEYVMLNLRSIPSTAKEIFDQQKRFKLVYDVDGLIVYRY
jgi:hypothetical protein